MTHYSEVTLTKSKLTLVTKNNIMLVQKSWHYSILHVFKLRGRAVSHLSRDVVIPNAEFSEIRVAARTTRDIN